MRRLALITVTFVAVLAAAVGLLPWWLGVLLNWIGGSWGVEFFGYVREGYSTFSVQRAVITRDNTQVEIHDLRARTPLLWWWDRVTQNPSEITCGTWSVTVTKRNMPSSKITATGWLPLKSTLARVADRLERWLPRAAVGAGRVTWPSGQLSFSGAKWEQRKLVVSEMSYRAFKTAAEVRISPSGEFHLVTNSKDQFLTTDLRAFGDRVEGQAKWNEQLANISAHFGTKGWLPEEGLVSASDWNVTADHLRLGEYYERLRGTVRLEWKQSALAVDASVEGEPLPKKKVPKTQAKLHGSFRDGVFTADTLQLHLPGITATLSQPVVVDRSGKLRSSPSEFAFDANLADQPWFAAKGTVHGQGKVGADERGLVAVDFNLAAENLSVANLPLSRLEGSARFAWPRLDVQQAKLSSADGTNVTGSGQWDFKERSLSNGKLAGQINRAFFEKWKSEYVKFGSITVDAAAAGTWPNLAHHGKVTANQVKIAATKELAVKVDWDAAGEKIKSFNAIAESDGARLTLSGSAAAGRADIATLTLGSKTEDWLTLANPTALHWGNGIEVEPLRLSGKNSSIEGSLRWGPSGKLALRVQHFDSSWLRAMFELAPTPWFVDSLTLDGTWQNGPASYAGKTVVTVDIGDQRPAQLVAEVRGAADGLEIVSLRGSEGEGVIVDASGHLPLTFQPTMKPLTKLDQNAAFSFHATTAPNPNFWKRITELSGVEAVRPEIQAKLEGKLSAPTGEISIKADRLAPVPNRFKFEWPRIENLSAHIVADRDALQLETFSLRVDDQAVRASGRLPASAAHWRDLAHDTLATLREGDWRIEVPDADVSAIAHHFPAYLAPKGKLHIDLAFKPDETVTGYLRLENATSRPIGPLGVLQEVNADLQFQGRVVTLDAATARMGGQLITLKGRAGLPRGEAPQLDFTLKGENLPFVRQTGLLVRGDLDLKLRSDERSTLIDGDVRLRDSLFLTDLTSFVPTGAKGAARRPPYFSVEAAPLNRWRLNVNVKGQRFLRLRTPLFRGVASAHLNLGGTLGNPRASGEATIDEGSVRLPFATFEVKQGQANLTPDQPEPQLLVNATTRRYGYDLRLDVTGAASNPTVTFSSSPPLESEQVLLMVMAGEAPHNEVATTDRQRATRFGAFFGQSILGTLSGDEGGADRLTISSGEDISQQGRETYEIEYKLNEKWSLTGEYDEFDEYYGGLKWRFYQKGGKNPRGE